jgi:E3 ubiquitin-protein ligase DOA10
MDQHKSYLERAIEFHSEKVKLYESVNKNFLYGILQYQDVYKDLFSEKEYVTILHFCFNQTTSVKSFFALLEEQLIEHGAIRMRRKQEEKARKQEEKEKERTAKFKELEESKKKEVANRLSQPVHNPEVDEPEVENKWAKRFLDLESKLKEQKQSQSQLINQRPGASFKRVIDDKWQKSDNSYKQKYDETKLQHVEAIVKSLYNKGTYSLTKISKMSGVDIDVVKQILNK